VTPFAERLRAELVAAAERQVALRRQRRRRALGGAATAALGGVAALLLVVLPAPSPAAADVVVRVEAGTISVTLVDLEHRPDRIEEAVRAAGLDVRIRAVPVGPSNIGRFVGQESTVLPPELHLIDATEQSFRGFALPVGWAGSLDLLVGAPADPDEPYAVFSDATEPGEPLACRLLAGRRLDAGAGDLRAADRLLSGLAIEGASTTSLSAGELAARRWSAWTVAGVDATSAGRLVVRLMPPGSAVDRTHPAGCPEGLAP
jgi:hypothetical protein